MCGEEYFKSSILSLWVTGVVYGVHILLFSTMIHLHIRRRISKWLIAISCLLFLLSSTQALVYLLQVILSPNVTSKYYCDFYACAECSDDSQTGDIMREVSQLDILSCLGSLCLVITVAISDALLLYRCYKIWQSRLRVIALPTILLIANIALFSVSIGITMTVHGMRMKGTWSQSKFDALSETMAKITRTQLALSFTTNMLLTALIVFRIWRTAQRVKDITGLKISPRYGFVLYSLIESGGLICASSLAAFILYGHSNYYKNGLISGFPFFQAISPTLLVVRVALGQGIAQALPTVRTLECDTNLPSGSLVFAHPASDAVGDSALAPTDSEESVLYDTSDTFLE